MYPYHIQRFFFTLSDVFPHLRLPLFLFSFQFVVLCNFCIFGRRIHDLLLICKIRLFAVFVRQIIKAEVSKYSSMFYVLVINTGKMSIRRQIA